jgi:hypothetical protein
MTTITAELIAAAEASHAKYPHYRGHWDGWVPVRIRRNLRSRGAPIATKGEIVLMDPNSLTTADHPDVIAGVRAAGFVTVFLPNHWMEGGIDTSVAYKDVTPL